MKTLNLALALALSTGFVVVACGGSTTDDAASGDEDLTGAPAGQPKIRTIAGQNGNTPGFADGNGGQAHFDYPEAMVLVGQSLYIADGRNHVIRKLDIQSRNVTTVAGKPGFAGHHDSDAGNGQFQEAHLSLPRSMVLSPDGKTIYFTDTGNFAVRALDVATNHVSTIAGGTPGFRDATGADAQFGDEANAPFWAGGLQIVGRTMYVADSANQLLRTIDLDTKQVKTIAGQARVRGHADGVGGAVIFNKPNQLQLDGRGNMYIGESDTPDIRKIDLGTGQVTTVAGGVQQDPKQVCDDSSPIAPRQPPECNFVDGPGAQARFRFPYGMDIDPANHRIFIVDAHNDLVRTLDIDTNEVKTVAGVQHTITNDQPHGSIDSTNTVKGEFWHPANVVFVAPNTLYLSDRSASAIRKITLP
jgi:sugar lactone lactonase YvrE